MWWANISFIDAKEITLTKSRDRQNPAGYEGALVFRVIDSNIPEEYRAAFLTADGVADKHCDRAALMFYACEKQAGMQLGVAPGTPNVDNDIESPHVAALRVQRVNGPDEEAMVWISTKCVDKTRPQYAPFRLAVIKENNENFNHSRLRLDALLSLAIMRTGQSPSSGRDFPFPGMSLRTDH